MTRPDILAAMTDQIATAVVIWGEARGEGLLGQAAVGSVIRNRVHASNGARSYAAVCTAAYQFSCLWETGANSDACFKLAEQLLTSKPILLSEVDLDLFRQCDWMAEGIVEESVMDVTKGATHYLTEGLYRDNPPKWAKEYEVVAAIGHHVFLKAPLRKVTA